MSDEIVHETLNGAVDPGQTADRPRKSRKRGKRNRSNASGPDLQVHTGPNQAPAEMASPVSGPPRERERGSRRNASQRRGSNGYSDGLDRFFCDNGLRFFPREWPVSHRTGLAIARVQEVSRRGNELLICDQLHRGDCQWPDGEPAFDRPSIDPEPSAHADVAPLSTPEVVQETMVDSGAEMDFDPETSSLAQLPRE